MSTSATWPWTASASYEGGLPMSSDRQSLVSDPWLAGQAISAGCTSRILITGTRGLGILVMSVRGSELRRAPETRSVRHLFSEVEVPGEKLLVRIMVRQHGQSVLGRAEVQFAEQDRGVV